MGGSTASSLFWLAVILPHGYLPVGRWAGAVIRGYGKDVSLPLSGLRDIVRLLVDIVVGEHTDKDARGAFIGMGFGALDPLITRESGKWRGQEAGYPWAE